jgi:hypothetical protein
MGPAYPGVPVSRVFQGEGSRSCSKGEHGVMSSCVYWEIGVTTKHSEKWSLELHRNFRGMGSAVLSCELFFPGLVASLFVDLERALLLTGYGPYGCLLGSSDPPFSG